MKAEDKIVDPKQHGVKKRDLQTRAEQIAQGSWGSDAVRAAIDEMMAAVVVAITAATTGVFVTGS